ncbi:PP2C family protein-serine/threonine phosphatase [Massilia sp. DWR3-1-1]|uniref:PP2C family protein-serine/threonine phosphatase n=1 Tax=Massilia sp. DWR3-1-1 TaxID=2804559 RepID=UPI003CF477C8
MTMPIPLCPMRLHHMPRALAFGATDIGPVRESNEDNFLFDEALGLSMVADGLGGHAAGDVASAAALTELRDYLAVHAAWSAPAAAVRLLHAAVEHANTRLYARNCARKQLEGGMGATLTGFWRPADAGALLIAFHVGDSRLYRLRAGALEQLTRDQTVYQQALEAGALDRLPARNLLLQALGPSASVAPEVRAHTVMPGDLLLLCSDGLHGSVADGEIEQLLAGAQAHQLESLCAQLIEMAKQYGGQDNMTVLLTLCH